MIVALSLLLFVSGATALGFEILWERDLRLLFGASTYSVAIVTAAFMGGLGVGYGLGRHRRLDPLHPLLVYGLAEAGIAAYAVAFPWLLATAKGIDHYGGGNLGLRASLAFCLLLPPTIAMGVSFPRLVALFASRTRPGRAAAVLYAANTLGAVLGTIGTSWYGIRLFGASSTLWLAVLANVSIAAVAIGLARFAPRIPRATRPLPSVLSPAAVPMVAAFLVGAQLMALQVVWNRTLVCAVESYTTSFALILAGVLCGTALGAAAYGAIARWLPVGLTSRVALFVAAEVALCLWVGASTHVMNGLYDLAAAMTGNVPVRSVEGILQVRLLLIAGPVVPASAAGAFLLPLLVDLRAAGDTRAEVAVSGIFGVEAAGSVAGALLAGFAAIPVFGLGGSLFGVAHLAVGTAALLALGSGLPRRIATIVVSAAALALLATFFVHTPLTLTRWFDGHQKIAGELLHYREGTFGTLAIFQVENRRELLINCIEEVPNHRDAVLLFKLLGHTPLLLHPEPQKVLVNAVGGGITLGAVTRHPVDVVAVELVPEVLEAFPFFARENGGVADRPGWRLVHDDGRNALELAKAGSFDVVTADATHPAAGESWPLYTREYYEIVHDRLAGDGLFAQWLPLHNLSPSDFRSVIATFRSVFEDVLFLFVNRYGILLGAKRQIRIDPEALSARLQAHPEVARDLASVGIARAEHLLRYIALDREAVDTLTQGASLVTDDHASVEFAELHRLALSSTFHPNLRLLEEAARPERLAARTGVPDEVFRARVHQMRARLRTDDLSLQSLYRAALDLESALRLAPDDLDARRDLEEVQASLYRIVARDHASLLNHRDLETFVDVFEYLHRTRPEEPLINQVLGVAFLRFFRFELALPYLERAAAARPDDFDLLSNLALAYEGSGRIEEALRMVARLEALQPSNVALAAFRERLEKKPPRPAP